MENPDIKSQLIQAGLTTGFMCLTMLIKHIISIRICHSKCGIFGHRLFEIDQQVSVQEEKKETPVNFDSLKIEIPK